MPVIVTAGHVDHGKSALVRALTGREPDRWPEERSRGMSIGLGFVWTRLPSGLEVSFVDAPGHRRLVSTMLAGATPAPAVLFVVAADEGWSAQSAEHLAALDALGTASGVLAITKCDRADPGPVMAAARRALAGTSLERIPAFAVSAVSGDGLVPLRHGLDTLVAGQDEAADAGADIRLWVDRSFTVAGAGTVVTATLAAGSLRLGDRLRCVRTGQSLRVRGLQVCERPVAVARPVRRVAVNLAGGHVDVCRGDALVAEVWRAVAEFDVVWRGVPGSASTLHVGTAAVPVRVRALGQGAARLRAEREVPVRPGDRVVVRDPGGAGPPAGAVVVDVVPEELTRRGAAARRGAELLALVAGRPSAPRGGETAVPVVPARGALSSAVLAGLAADLLRRKRFLRHSDFGAVGLPVSGHLVGSHPVTTAAGITGVTTADPATADPVTADPVTGAAAARPDGRHWRADPATWAALTTRIRDEVATWRADRPLTPAIPLPALTSRLSLPSPDITRELLRAAGLSTEDRTTGPPLPDSVEAALVTLTKSLRQNPFRAPEALQLANAGLRPPELAAAVRAGRLLQLAPGVVVLPDTGERAAQVLRGLTAPFTVSQARRAWGTTRRTAVPLLELLDRSGVTNRLRDGTRELA
ncbi:hypothetical protein BBK82_30750 [Lentzea guizhouensis]|uniref:Tr-type G domain-containing protein n=1 Tax=Lentzea guizhouensis TaxID=1586287 RepID=A0A1B2HPX6_9PSEU|nr:selenocysteine-specific translation elongation factor [Lentzea guizhouensis]ANZ39768.1 hypothetical protein BBK82_30750 [Lentzea guizhouensis]